jgi:hypothetical protein
VANHRKRNTLIGTIAAGLVFVVAAFFAGAFNSLGGKTVDRVVRAAEPSKAGNRLPLSIAVETNQAKTTTRASEWSAPETVPKPTFGGSQSCSTLNSWGSGEPRASAADPVYQITLTGDADVSVVIHRVWPKLVKKEPMPPGWMTLSCPQGGPLDAISAVLDLKSPDATTYEDANGRPLPRLAYSLTRGEAGVFYTQVFNGGGQGRITWDVMLDVTVGNRSQTVNVNEMALKGKHFVTTALCGTRYFEYGGYGKWIDGGPSPSCEA